jgi:hypothetical protein
MILVDIFNFINSILPESTILAATIFSGMGSGTQSGKLLFKGLCSDTNISISQDSTSVKICDTSSPVIIAVDDAKVAIGDVYGNLTASIFSVNTTWESISKPDTYKGLILSNVPPQSYYFYNSWCSLIVAGRKSTAKGKFSGSTIIGGYDNTLNSQNSSIIGGVNNGILSRSSTILGSCGSVICNGPFIQPSPQDIPDSTIVSSIQSVICNSVRNNSIIGSNLSCQINSKGTSIVSSCYSLLGYVSKSIECSVSYSADISGFKNTICAKMNKSKSSDAYNSIISSNKSYTCGIKNSTIISNHKSCICDSELSTIISGQCNDIRSATSSSILGGYYNKIFSSKYSSIFGGCHNSVDKSNYSSIFTSKSSYPYPNLIYDSCNSSIMASEKSKICNSCFSTILSSCYGHINNSKFSTLYTRTVPPTPNIDKSCNVFLVSINYSCICDSDNSMMIVTDSQNYIKKSTGAAIIGSQKNIIITEIGPIIGKQPPGENRGENNIIHGSYKSWICEYTCGVHVSCNNLVSAAIGGTVCASANSGVIGSYQARVGPSSKNSLIVGSGNYSCMSGSTNSVIIGSLGVTMSGSINSAIVAGIQGKTTLYNSVNTTRTSHIQINGSASIFNSGIACFTANCTFTCNTVACIVVCHGFIVRLE